MFSKKSRTRRISFSLRLALICTGALCFTLTIVLSMTYQLVRHVTRERDHDVIQAQAIQYKALFERGGIAAVSSYFNQQIGVSSQQAFVRIVDKNERVHFVTIFHPVWSLLDQKTSVGDGVYSERAHWDELFRDESTGSWVVGTTPLSHEFFLQVGRSTSESRLVLQHFRNVVLAIILPIMVLSLLAGWLMTRGILTPLRSLIDTIHRIFSSGDLTHRVPVSGRRG